MISIRTIPNSVQREKDPKIQAVYLHLHKGREKTASTLYSNFGRVFGGAINECVRRWSAFRPKSSRSSSNKHQQDLVVDVLCFNRGLRSRPCSVGCSDRERVPAGIE